MDQGEVKQTQKLLKQQCKYSIIKNLDEDKSTNAPECTTVEADRRCTFPGRPAVSWAGPIAGQGHSRLCSTAACGEIDYLCLAAKMCGVFIRRILPSRMGGHLLACWGGPYCIVLTGWLWTLCSPSRPPACISPVSTSWALGLQAWTTMFGFCCCFVLVGL